MFGSTSFLNDMLFIGDAIVAADEKFMKENNIKLIVNMTTRVPNYFKDIAYINLPVSDSNDAVNNEIMKNHLIRIVPIILQYILAGQPVLVHCWAGVSRSCTVVAAVLRSCCVKTIKEATNMIVEKRPSAFYGNVHFFFMKALEALYLF